MQGFRSINQSYLYKIPTKRRLAEILGITLPLLNCLKEPSAQYRARQKQVKAKTRFIHLPLRDRMKAHRRIFQLLTQIAPPEYLHSGVKERSFKTNAAAHQFCKQLIKFDLKDFYPSTKIIDVVRMFSTLFQCPTDIAEFLGKICCYKNQIPIGSPVSQVVAFYSHKNLFEDLNQIALESELIFTCYVDDLTFSGKHIPKGFAHKIKRRIQLAGLISHKNRLFLDTQPKEVTGVIITTKNELKPTNKNFGNLITALRELHAASSIQEYEAALNRFNGLQGYRKYVNPNTKLIAPPKFHNASSFRTTTGGMNEK